MPSQQSSSTWSMSSLLVSDADSSKQELEGLAVAAGLEGPLGAAHGGGGRLGDRDGDGDLVGPGSQARGGLVDRHEPDQLAVDVADRDEELVVLLPPVGVVGAVVAADDRADAAEVGLVDRAGRDEVGAADVELRGRAASRPWSGAPCRRGARSMISGGAWMATISKSSQAGRCRLMATARTSSTPRELLHDPLEGAGQVLVQGARSAPR